MADQGLGTTSMAIPMKEPSKNVALVRLPDSANCKVYICFEGTLGAQLKVEVREKIWWGGGYVEITLLPLEKFNLDRMKPEESKKEDEEKRRYWLIPRTFSNWLQAFAILASVIGEKAQENCSPLFCYLDSIGKARRVYGGIAVSSTQGHPSDAAVVSQGHQSVDETYVLSAGVNVVPPPPILVGSPNAPGQPVSKRQGQC